MATPGDVLSKLATACRCRFADHDKSGLDGSGPSKTKFGESEMVS